MVRPIAYKRPSDCVQTRQCGTSATNLSCGFNTIILCVLLCDNNTLRIEDDGSRKGLEASRGHDRGERHTVKALMSMGEAWKRAFNDRVGQVQSRYEAQNDSLEVNDFALALNRSSLKMTQDSRGRSKACLSRQAQQQEQIPN